MSTRVVDRVDEWRERPFSDGYRSLHELADEGFSGAVRAGGAELYMTKGAVVGIRHGDIEDFDGSGTAYEAPSPALPLLAVMQETNDEVRAEYYTEKTAIAEVDSTLSDGGFTGYVELADNVLSGDYYQVYHAGQSMSVGFIGESSRLVDGDEAFETANDEVGIYQVRPADIEIIDLPEVEAPATDDDEDTEDDEPQVDDDAADDEPDSDTEDDEPATEAEDETEDADATADRDETATTESTGPARDEQAATQEPAQTGAAATQAVEQQAGAAASGESSPQGGQMAETKQQAPEQTRSRQRSRSTEEPNLALETRAIPSLDPTKTAEPDESNGGARADTFERATESRQTHSERGHTQQSQESTEQPAARSAADQTGTEATTHTEPESAGSQPDTDTSADESGERAATDGSHSEESTEAADPERIEELESEIADRDDEIERLESELDRKTTEYEDAKSQLETVREERDELATEVEQLREELERLETELGAATDAERRITPAEALAGTDIFPRYNSKGDATLEKAHGGSHRREDVLGNLRLEQNTQFDADTVAVGGQEYGEFLESTLEYRFVNWVVGNLLFEIRETGHEKALKDLYDALPVIDWADLKGTVDVVYKEDGQETRSEESFDIVLRNRMGEPLLVANVNDSREGATQSMMENLVRAAERVGQTSDAFAGAFLVTRSFFEPPALETADDATKSGLLSRSKRKSFVNLSRKRGYHLCLIEARNENFTMLVPEL